jgi:hypothetical protein
VFLSFSEGDLNYWLFHTVNGKAILIRPKCFGEMMTDPLSIQELKTSYEDLSNRVGQLGRFL